MTQASELNDMLKGFCAKEIAAESFTGAVVTTDGFRAVTVGYARSRTRTPGLAEPAARCDPWDATSAALEDVWLEFDTTRLVGLYIKNPSVRTVSGARVGMSVAELERRYAGKLVSVSSMSEGGMRHSRAMVSGNQSVAFQVGVDSERTGKVQAIAVEHRDRPLVGGC